MPSMFVVTTPRHLEPIAASHVREVPGVDAVEARPAGYQGLLRVSGDDVDVDAVLAVPETEKVVPVETVLQGPGVTGIAKAVADVADPLPEASAFAVRCTRRGSHGFSSLDVEREGGTAVQAVRPDLEVDLDAPDVILRVEILDDWVGVGRFDPDQVHRKFHGKPAAHELTSRTTVVQRLYEADDPRGVDRVAAAIGRSAQALEVRRLAVALDGPTDADAVTGFLDGVRDGVGSRHAVQRRSVDRDVDRVPVQVVDLYQMARLVDRDDTVVVMTDPRGVARTEADGLGRDLVESDAIIVFNGSNRGLPPGVFELADHVLDLAPRMTYGTDQAVTAALVGLLGAWERG